ncbi:MAG: endonuclease domain-containing protein [Anaerolineaceae bacterium]
MKRIRPKTLRQARKLRDNQTDAEKLLWQELRDSQLKGMKFRRQSPIGRFIVDFYCAEKKLVIEVDGDTHCTPEQMAYDAARTAWLEEQGMRVARITNIDVMENLDAVLEWIAKGCA